MSLHPIYEKQWCSQNTEKDTHIKGRLLDESVILINCGAFQYKTSIKG